MIIKAKPFPFSLLVFVGRFFLWMLRRKFRKIAIYSSKVEQECSYIFMSNHFSFLDGAIAGYILKKELYDKKVPVKGLYIMILEKQLSRNKWIRKFGGFSIAPGTDTVNESLAYAAEILSTPGNVLLLYPQGKIESNHVDFINMKRGLADIVPQISGKCQLLWSSNLIDYYEGINPSLYCHMLDCGTNIDFNFEKVCAEINVHHATAIEKQVRFPKV